MQIRVNHLFQGKRKAPDSKADAEAVHRNLYFDIRICVLPMLFCIVAILNGKLGATVQTAQTHDTRVLDPDRLFSPHFNRLYRAFSGT